jgi:type I restriction enzyme S subunit
VLAAKPGVSADYLFHYLFSTDIQDQINAIVTGSSYPAINSSDVERLFVRCPPLAEQRTIASILDTADESIRAETAQRELLMRQKQGLMQQLLTGKRRVRLDQPHPFDEPCPLAAIG